MNAKNLKAIRTICTEKAADFAQAVLADIAAGTDSTEAAAKETAYLKAVEAITAILDGQGTEKLEALRASGEYGAALAEWIAG